MPLKNARWLIGGILAALYTQGRRAETAVDIENFPEGILEFSLEKRVGPFAEEIMRQQYRQNAVVIPAETAALGIDMNFIWEVLRFTDSFDIIREAWRTGEEVQYPFDASFLDEEITDLTLWPEFGFEVSAASETPAVSPPIHRDFPKYTENNVVEVLIDGNEALPRIVGAINSATHYIHLDWFFFGADEAGNVVTDALISKAQTGVQVRLLFNHDATGKRGSLGGGFDPADVRSMVQRMKNAGAHVEKSEHVIPTAATMAILRNPEYRDRAKKIIEYFKQIGLIPYVASVDHQKIIIIDGITSFCGGMNCSNSYLFFHPFDPNQEVSAEVQARRSSGLPEAWVKWHDAFAMIYGPASRDLQRIFAERWALATGEELDPNMGVSPIPVIGNSRVKVLANVPGLERDISSELIRMFRNASNKILVQNPYFTDDLLALYLIHAARVRGVHVDLILPDEHHDIEMIRKLMQLRYKHFINAGINVYEYRNHFTHVKAAAVDGRYVCLGGYNFAKGATIRDFECNILIDDPNVAEDVEHRLFETDRTRSTRITTPPDVQIFAIPDELLEPYL